MELREGKEKRRREEKTNNGRAGKKEKVGEQMECKLKCTSKMKSKEGRRRMFKEVWQNREKGQISDSGVKEI